MDRSDLVAVYERWQQPLYRYCLSIVGEEEDARDALQNAMVKALRALPEDDREIQLKPWLYRIAHNESIEMLRRRRDQVELDPEAVEAAVGPADAAALRERLRTLFRDLGRLPERQRAALTMRELAGLEFAEVGEALETSAAVARQTVYEARLGLREMEAGREMSCRDVMRQLSDADGRVVRRRDLQAHLRDCADCRAFQASIESRREDLAALSPLPAIVAAGLLKTALASAEAGGALASGGAAGSVAAGAGKAAATGIVAKSVATVAVVAAIGTAAADRSGLIDLVPAGDEPAATRSGGGNGPLPDRAQGPARGPAGQSTPAAPRAAKESGRAAAEGRGGQNGTAASHAAGGSPAAAQQGGGSGTLPQAAQHGQETAQSHGGGRAHGESRSQEGGGGAPGPAGGQGSSNAASPPVQKPKPSTPPPPTSGQVDPDEQAAPPSKPAEPPKGNGSAGASGGSPKEEAG